ncbi:hypothetical protein [Pseudoalteromonas sp. ECSMB14103]|uniref:hypothetical protein n=1 Tax=Pseudoalteromonas sp. ECSMB14103 TaxID=1580062 RepID=UPI000A8E028F|nr:hypothetical protein [Pseudoalteromonas sp. ECSMB14103]
MRFPTFPEFLFAMSMVFFIAFISAFNSELLGGEPLCELNLLSEKQENCILNDKSLTNFRVVVHSGGNSKTVTVKVPITIVISDSTVEKKFEDITPKAASTGGGRRYYSNLNYGIYELPNESKAIIRVTANDTVKRFSLFNAKILKNANNYYVHLLGLIFLVVLFFSIYNRKRIFVKGIGKPLPYILYFFVVMLVLTWAL